MNKARREELTRIGVAIRQAAEDLQSVLDEEQEAFEAMPESLQGAERGQAMESAIAEIEQAINYCDEIDNFLQSAVAV